MQNPLPESSKTTPVKNPNVRIVLGDVTEHNILQLKKINTAILPVSYQDSFYKEILASEIHSCQLAYFNDLVVGGYCYRVEDSSDMSIGINTGPTKTEKYNKIINADKKRLYIMTLGCLSAYRRYGVGSQMVESIIQQAADYGDVDGIYLHVQTNNEAAKFFYEKLGFKQIGGVMENYYCRLDVCDAYLLGYEIKPSGVKKLKLSANVNVVSNILEKEKDAKQKAKMDSIKSGKGQEKEVPSVTPVNNTQKSSPQTKKKIINVGRIRSKNRV